MSAASSSSACGGQLQAATARSCAFCADPAVRFFRHCFPFAPFSAPLLSAPMCATHYYQAGAVLMTAPAEFLPQLPAESDEQREYRETAMEAYARLCADPESEAARWARVARRLEARDSECRVCRLSDAQPPVQHRAVDLHSICSTEAQLSGEQVGVASLLPQHARAQQPEDLWCGAHIWDAVRLLQHWDARAEGGRGNVRSYYRDTLGTIDPFA